MLEMDPAFGSEVDVDALLKELAGPFPPFTGAPAQPDALVPSQPAGPEGAMPSSSHASLPGGGLPALPVSAAPGADALSFSQYRERPSSSRASPRESPFPMPPPVTSSLAYPAVGPGGTATPTLEPQRRSRPRGVTFGVYEEMQMRRALAAANGITMVNDTLPLPSFPLSTGTGSALPDALPQFDLASLQPRQFPSLVQPPPLLHSLSEPLRPILNDSAVAAGEGVGWPTEMDTVSGDDSAACSPYYTPCASPVPGSRTESPYGRSRAAAGTKPRRYPRSHTCREPERCEFATQEEYDKAWATWRQIRDCNNEAVRKSRNYKKAILGCNNAACLSMLRDLKSSEKTTELLIKAALTPHALTRAERKAYNRIIAERAPEGMLPPGAASPIADLRKQLSASDLSSF